MKPLLTKSFNYKIGDTKIIKLTKNSKTTTAEFPYYEPAIKVVKGLGGKWDAEHKVWTVNNNVEQDLREAFIAIFGTDGSTDFEVLTVKLTLHVELESKIRGALNFAGKLLSNAYGRNTDATHDEDVAYIEGACHGGGRAKNWRSVAEDGSVIKMFNVLPALLNAEEIDEDVMTVEIVNREMFKVPSEEIVDMTLKDYTTAELLAEIAKRCTN